jgi:hypothetical protein
MRDHHCSHFDQFEIDSFGNVEDGLEEVEVTVVEEAEEEEEPEIPDYGAEEEERLIGTLDLPEDWNTGKFEVNIIHCNDCYLHYHYSRHSEDEHVD